MLVRIPHQDRARRTSSTPTEPIDPQVALRAWLHRNQDLRHTTLLSVFRLNRLKAELRELLPEIGMIAANLGHMGLEVVVTRSPDMLDELRERCPEVFCQLIRALARRPEPHIQTAISPYQADAVRPFR